MKNNLLAIFVAFTGILSLNGCTDEAGHTINDIVGTYVGAMNVSNPSFTNALYTVTVTKANATTVTITPSTGAASTWSAGVMNISGYFTCTTGCLQNQITFTYQADRWIVAYNYGSNNEQYSGTKQ